MVEEAFICPFCGAPHRTLIPAGAVQVKCRYCGATVLVPPRLGGAVQRCPNHPDILAVGLCNDCGKSYCDRCLYIHKVKDGRLHVCSKCYENRNTMKRVGAFFSLALSILFFVLFLILSAKAIAYRGDVPLPLLFPAFSFLAVFIAAFLDVKKNPLSVHDAPTVAARGPKAFLKRCVKCGREIPIASEECQYCITKQPEYVEP